MHRVKGNCRYSAYGVMHMDTWLDDGDWDLIHFNFGLWDWYGWSQEPKASLEAYAANLERIVTKLQATQSKIIFALTTPPCVGPERKVKITITEERAKEFNDTALAVMEKHGVEINDLYTLMSGNRVEYQQGPGNVHYHNEAKQLQANQVAKTIENALAKITASAETAVPATRAEDAAILRLWPIEQVGGEQNRLKELYRDRRGRKQLCGIIDPYLTVYPAKSAQPTPAVVYCPGGAYKILGIPSAETIKQWNDLGITLFVLKYTIPDNPNAAFEDVQRAMRLVRHQAKKWNVDPNNIGLFGNSAGGHLSARLTQNYDQKAYQPIDEADRLSCEPNFALLQCAAYFQGQKLDKDFDAELFHMKHKVAPTFLTYSKDDKFCVGGKAYAKKLNEAGGTIHLELFEKGGHGMGGCDWFTPMSQWLKKQQIIK